MNKTITYFHNCNCGDLICALPGMKEIYRKFGKKAVIYQKLDVPGHYMPGLVHSVKDEKGTQVTMNQKMLDMLRPLLLSQAYVEDFQVYDGQKIEIDLTIIREGADPIPGGPSGPSGSLKLSAPKQFVNIPHMAIPGWTMLAYPATACDISKPWIDVEKNGLFEDKILINRTERYFNKEIDYGFLKPYESDLIFTGTEREHAKFCKDHGLNFPRLGVDDFLDLAQVMASCRFFLGNQSFPWNLANAMGAPRILEMFFQAPNCQPFIGEDNFGSPWQIPLQYFFEDLYKRKAAPKGAANLAIV